MSTCMNVPPATSLVLFDSAHIAPFFGCVTVLFSARSMLSTDLYRARHNGDICDPLDALPDTSRPLRYALP